MDLDYCLIATANTWLRRNYCPLLNDNVRNRTSLSYSRISISLIGYNVCKVNNKDPKSVTYNKKRMEILVVEFEQVCYPNV